MSPNKKSIVQPYLFFEGRCEEAVAFYSRAIGAKVVMMMRNSESPEPPPPGCVPPGSESKIMHVQLQIGETVVMASDGRCTGKPQFGGFALSLSAPTEADADRLFGALADGGQIQMPLNKTFFSPRFGMVIDKFGVFWMVIVHKESL